MSESCYRVVICIVAKTFAGKMDTSAASLVLTSTFPHCQTQCDIIALVQSFSCLVSVSRLASILCAVNITAHLSFCHSGSNLFSPSPPHHSHLKLYTNLHLHLHHHQRLNSKGSWPKSYRSQDSVVMMGHLSLITKQNN